MTALPRCARPSRRPTTLCTLTLLALLLPVPAAALITFNLGNDPVQDMGWPEGSLAVANLTTRVVLWDGPLGDAALRFAYRGDTTAFQDALDHFGRIDAPERVLVVHEGPDTLSFLKDEKDPKSDGRYDWKFTVYNPEEFERERDRAGSRRRGRIDDAAGKPARKGPPPPQIDVYIGGAPADQGIDWSLVNVPDSITVKDERASANGYPAGSGSVVRGQVLDMVTGRPVDGARVVVARYVHEKEAFEEVLAGPVGADGKFDLARVPPGAYSVHAEAPGRVTRALGHETFGKDTLKEFPPVRLARPATLGGRVTDGDGKPVKDLAVRAGGVLTAEGGYYPQPAAVIGVTDASGHFTLPGLPEGQCELSAYAKGLRQVDPFKEYRIPAQDAAIRMSATGAIRGKLTEAGGAPTGGPYLVELAPTEGRDRPGAVGGVTNVNADGTFTFDGVPPDSYTVTFRLNPGPEANPKDARRVEVKAGETAEVEIEVK